MKMTAEEYLKRWDKIISEARQITNDKTKLYGVGSIGELGARGEFVQIHRKYTRLRKMIWDGNVDSSVEKKYNDTVRDTLLDMINYSVIMLIAFESDEHDIKKNVKKD